MMMSKPYRQTSFVDGPEAPELTADGLFTTPTTDVSERTGKYAQGGTPLAAQVKSGLSPEGIPASRSHTPGSDWARRMTAISGRGFVTSLPISGPAGACLKTLLGTSRWGSTLCWLTWNRSTTPAGRSLFRLRPSAPRTGGTASGSSATGEEMWWTLTASLGHSDFNLSEQMAAKARLSGGGNLHEQMAQRMWPTLRAEGYDAGNHPNSVDSLPAAVKMWPTPDASLHKYRLQGNSQQSRCLEAQARRGELDPTQAPAKLSAAWVTRLMGYPDGWLDLPE